MPYFALAQMPMPEDNNDDAFYNDEDGREIGGRAEASARNYIRTLKEIGVYEKMRGHSILDVGCGCGYLLRLLDRAFGTNPPMPWGVEPNYTARANKVYGFIRPSIDDANMADYVMAWNVIEHVKNPVEFIQSLKSKSHKYIIIATPNADSPFAKSGKWRYKIQQHRYLFGKGNLCRLFVDNGIKVVKHITYGGYPAPRKPWQSVANWFAKKLGLGDIQVIIGEIGGENSAMV